MGPLRDPALLRCPIPLLGFRVPRCGAPPVPVVLERVMVLVLPVCINRRYIMGKIEDSESPTDIIVFKEKKERS